MATVPFNNVPPTDGTQLPVPVYEGQTEDDTSSATHTGDEGPA